MYRPRTSFFTPVYTNNYTNNTNSFLNAFMNLFAAFNAPTVAQKPAEVSEPVTVSEPVVDSEPVEHHHHHTHTTDHWGEFFTNKAQLGEELVNNNEDKFFSESEGTEYVDEDFAFEFFNKMQYEKGDNNKFHVRGIDGELNALSGTDSLAQKREKAMLEAIKAADADNDGIVTTDEFMHKIEDGKGLVISF
ncbi:MAG: hypothetical protein A2Y25_10920 [Candidatus Melainabacteria bacterium GWF2_37_15]|nr:MAG: hypothetical protein A2Y25_10920 [Candidatus Melainabacteria bacterium GWF2_37_15]